ncbi:MAG: O-antigen ligase family protein [Xanthobacteraceae bacterium]
MTGYDLAAPAPQLVARVAGRGRLVNGLLFITIFASPFVFIEPSPYEAAFALLALAFLVARVPIGRGVVPLALLLFLWNLSGVAALIPVLHDPTAITFMVTSLYLAVTAIMFACLFTEDIVRRLSLVRTAYIVAALIAAAIGIAAYFHLLPDSERFLLGAVRAKSTFKDPNVYGPFLILPLLFLIDRTLREGVRPARVVATLILLLGLFLSFSRGAWANFMVSAGALMLFMFLTSPTPRFRARVLAFGLMALAGLVLLLAALLSFDAIGAVFQERANLLQPYDAGPGGRFGRQLEGAMALLERPLGVGPLQFARHWGQDPHNVYLNAFASYGWIGGFAYLMLVLTTLTVGFRALPVRTPWQSYLLLALAAFIGAAFEGIVIDSDHWRHYYLLLGLIWGLAIATTRAASRRNWRPATQLPPRAETAAGSPPIFRLG